MDQGSNENHSPVNNFVPTVTKFCVLWEGQALPHDTKFGNCRDKIVDSRAFLSWSLIHGSSWSGLIKLGPGFSIAPLPPSWALLPRWQHHLISSQTTHKPYTHLTPLGGGSDLYINLIETASLFQRQLRKVNAHFFRIINIRSFDWVSAWEYEYEYVN